MTVRHPRYSKEDFAKRGNDIYETRVRSKIEEGNEGKIVAIEIETCQIEFADFLLASSILVLRKVPVALTLFVRIGYPVVDHFGARSLRTQR